MSDHDVMTADYDSSFTRIYRRYNRVIAGVLRKMVYSRDISEELCQDVFLRVYEKRVSLDPDSPRTVGFLKTAARNAAIDYIRRKKREDLKIRSLQIDDAVMDRQFYEDIENACLRGEIISTLSDTINSFPERERRLFIARSYGNRSGASMARDSGMSAYRIRKIEEKIVERIRDRMEHYFEPLD